MQCFPTIFFKYRNLAIHFSVLFDHYENVKWPHDEYFLNKILTL